MDRRLITLAESAPTRMAQPTLNKSLFIDRRQLVAEQFESPRGLRLDAVAGFAGDDDVDVVGAQGIDAA